MLGRKAFDVIWGKVDEEEPPEPDQRDVSLPKLAIALLIEARYSDSSRVSSTMAPGADSNAGPGLGRGKNRRRRRRHPMNDSRVADGSRDDEEPTERRDTDFAPTGVERRTGLWPTLKRTALEFQEDNLSDWAATLTTTGCSPCSPR